MAALFYVMPSFALDIQQAESNQGAEVIMAGVLGGNLDLAKASLSLASPFGGIIALVGIIGGCLMVCNVRLRRAVAARTSELERLNASLKDALRIDMLSGISNRLAAIENLQREFSSFRRYRTIYSVIMFDIDRFKVINDTYGHEIGDRVIANLSQRVKSMIRETDFVSRFGGEEFLILLPETELADAVRVAEKLRDEVERLRFDFDISVTISAGVAFPHFEDMRFDDVVRRADTLMYKAKSAGRNRIESETPEAVGADGKIRHVPPAN